MKKRNNRLSSGTGATLAALACLFLLLLLCAACTQESGVPGAAGGNPPAGAEDDPQAGTELVVGSVSIGTAATDATGGQTRAATPVPLTSGSIGIGVRAENGYAAQQVKYTYNRTTGKWEPDGTPGIQLKSDTASLYAWYPYELNKFGDNEVILQYRNYTTALNLCYSDNGSNNVCATYPDAKFELKSVYARLKVKIMDVKKEDTTNPSITLYPAGYPSDSYAGFTVVAHLSLLDKTVTINPADGNVFPLSLPIGFFARWNNQTQALEADILLIPDESYPIEKIRIDLQTKGLLWEFSLGDGQIKLEAGKFYTMDIYVGGGGIGMPTVEEGYFMENMDQNGVMINPY